MPVEGKVGGISHLVRSAVAYLQLPPTVFSADYALR